ncbi:MAG: LysR substrate-binding domain-containing protein [Pseudomonadota bacterium]
MASRRDSALNRIRLRHLQCFLAVAESGTLRGAAERLAISQPAVTKTLAELEQMLGCTLFERGRGGAKPTPEAESFLRHATASVQSLQSAVDSVLRGPMAPLKLGVLPTVAPLMPPVLQAVLAAHAGLQLQVHTGRNAQLLAQLRAGELDAVVGRLAEPDAMAGLSFELLWAEPLAVAVRAGHALLRKRGAAAPVWAPWPLVLPLPGTLIRHAADGLLARLGIEPHAGVVETLSVSLGAALAQQADAVWIAPRSAVLREVEAGRLQLLPVDTAGSEEPVGLLLRSEAAPVTPALRTLLQRLRGAAGSAGR